MIAEVRNLVKRYPSFELSEVSFCLDSGRITGFIGRNGAGKTTTIKAMLNLIHLDGGTVSFFGKPLAGNEAEIKKLIGYSTGTVSWYPRKKIRDIVDIVKRFYETWDEEIYRRYLDLFGLDETKTPLELSEGKHLIRVHNKCDDASALPQPTDTDVWISAKYGYGLEQLNNLLVKAAAIPEISEQDVIVTNMSHYESLIKAQECIRRVRQGLKDRISGDFLSQDIRQCIHHLSTITGDITTDQILGNIFQHFCIGK